jgi:hypothetical protein
MSFIRSVRVKCKAKVASKVTMTRDIFMFICFFCERIDQKEYILQLINLYTSKSEYK